MTFQRIIVDPEICGGKPCIRGMRVPVSRLLGLLAAGETSESILQSHPYLELEDIQEALSYAAFLAEERAVYKKARGILPAEPSLTKDLLAERAKDKEREEAIVRA